MCTTWSTKNRAVITNNYATNTILTNKDAYCPCGPNKQDYRYRSKSYNPDPKYQCHLDLTCHQFDSIPKAMSCDGYGAPTSQSIYNQTMGPASSMDCPDSCTPNNIRPQRCRRRVVRQENCCLPKPTLREFMSCVECCEVPEPCCDSEDAQDDCNESCQAICLPECPKEDEIGGYSVQYTQETEDCCGSKVTYNCGPCGDVCKTVKMSGGNQIQMSCQRPEYVMLETSGNPACACGGQPARICIDSCTPCPTPTNCCPMVPCCPPKPRPPPRCCTRKPYCPPTPCCPPQRCCPPKLCSPPDCCPPPVCCAPFSCCPCPPQRRLPPCGPPTPPRRCCLPPCCPYPCTLRCCTGNMCKKTTVGATLGCCGSPCLECRPRFRNP